MDATMGMDTDGMGDRVCRRLGCRAFLLEGPKGKGRGWTTKQMATGSLINSTGTGLQRTKGSFSFCLSLVVHSPLLKLACFPSS